MNQTTLLRKLTGVARLEQAFLLSDFVRELARKGIQRHSKMGKPKESEKLKERLRYA